MTRTDGAKALGLGPIRSFLARRGLFERAAWQLDWRRATKDEWPPLGSLGHDFDWARKTGTGFISECAGETLYLIDRDFSGWPDPPEWSLASIDHTKSNWQPWGDFYELPSGWKVPEPLYAQN